MSEESDFNDELPMSWIEWFCSQDQHSFLCEINPDFLRQPFNLYGLKKMINNFDKALQMILKPLGPQEQEIQDPKYLELYQNATELYGSAHARYICTPEGLGLMRQKFLTGKFGTCPRVLCEKQNVIPIGISEFPKISRVKVFCPRCKDVYASPKKFSDVDGAYFGCSFPHLLLMSFPDLKPQFKREEYEATVFGFKYEESPSAKIGQRLAQQKRVQFVKKIEEIEESNVEKKKKKKKNKNKSVVV